MKRIRKKLYDNNQRQVHLTVTLLLALCEHVRQHSSAWKLWRGWRREAKALHCEAAERRNFLYFWCLSVLGSFIIPRSTGGCAEVIFDFFNVHKFTRAGEQCKHSRGTRPFRRDFHNYEIYSRQSSLRRADNVLIAVHKIIFGNVLRFTGFISFASPFAPFILSSLFDKPNNCSS